MPTSGAGDIDSALDQRVDPVAEAEAYRRMLLDLLGDQDPAQVQAELPDQLQAMIEEAGPHLWTRPAPSEWSVLELLGHLLDSEITSAGRYRWILAHDEPPLIGYDQDLWPGSLGGAAAPPGRRSGGDALAASSAQKLTPAAVGQRVEE